MSNELKGPGVVVPGLLACLAAILASCATKTPQEEDAGLPFRKSAVEVAVRVSEYTPMNKACFNTAVGIVEGGVAVRLAQTEGQLRHAVLVSGLSQAEWARRSCPPKALPGLAFGTSDVANSFIFRAHTAASVE